VRGNRVSPSSVLKDEHQPRALTPALLPEGRGGKYPSPCSGSAAWEIETLVSDQHAGNGKIRHQRSCLVWLFQLSYGRNWPQAASIVSTPRLCVTWAFSGPLARTDFCLKLTDVPCSVGDRPKGGRGLPFVYNAD